MIFKNKNNTVALKIENTISFESGFFIMLLPTIDIFYNNLFEIGFNWLFVSVQFWFGDVKDLI